MKRKKYFSFALSSLIRTFVSMNHPYRLPAEWERQSMVQLTWPHAGTDWADMLDEINEVYVIMAREIARRERLLIVTPEPEHVQELLGDMENVVYCCCPTDDTWARDHGFITLEETGRGGNGDFILKDFRFNGWGEKFPAANDNMINSRLWNNYSLFKRGVYEGHDNFVLEGGSIESDGQGTVFTTSQCLLAPHRNQPLTKDQIELKLKNYLCADRIVWLDHGNLIGDDTDGHIDTIVRCAPDDTLLYIGCDDKTDGQYEDFRLLEQQLLQLRTRDGKPYRLLRLPMPDAIYEEVSPGNTERLPATYANFLILNGAVLVPTYGQPAKDAEALRIIGKAFPDSELVAIDSRAIIRQHGSIHCCTMQFPEGV